MLSTEHQIQIDGVTLFRDLQDENKYYYLPSDEVKIADDGKKIHLLAYVDGDIKEGAAPSFDNNSSSGGFLTLEVELGPDKNTVTSIRNTLVSKTGKTDITLVPVPLKSGDVRMVMFGSEGKDSDNVKLSIAGSTKPSLIGRQTAVFSLNLGSKEAQIFWNILTNPATSQTQIAIMYDLTFLGIMPNHKLEITVDFSQVEKYYSHHFGADLDFKIDNKDPEKDKKQEGQESTANPEETEVNYDVGIMADVDVDIMFQDLVSNGAIVIKHTDYTTDGAGSPLPDTDSTGMTLVKQLLSTELFTIQPMPTDDFTASNNAGKKEGEKKEDGKKDGDKVSSLADKVVNAATDKAGENKGGENKGGENKTQETKSADAKTAQTKVTENKADSKGPEKTPAAATDGNAEKEAREKAEAAYPEFAKLKHAKPEYITKEEWLENALPEADFTGELLDKEKVKGDDGSEKEIEVVKEEKYNAYRQSKIDEAVEKAKKKASPTRDEKKSKSAKTINIKGDLKLAYSYKKRDAKESITRTYTFDKQQAQTYEYHPCGMLRSQLTDTQLKDQAVLVRMGEAKFKNVEVKFTSGIDFDKYHLKEILVEFSHQAETDGTILSKAFSLTKETQSATFNFISEAFATGKKGMDLNVNFIFDGKAKFLGFGSSQSSFMEQKLNVKDKSILIDASYLTKVLPVEIENGSIVLGNEGVSSVSVCFDKVENDQVTLLGEFPLTAEEGSRIVLLNPDAEYRKRIVYTFGGKKYDGTLCTSKTLSVTRITDKGSDILVNEPEAGMVKIHTFAEEGTFEGDIMGISVSLKKGEKALPAVNLTKACPAVYLVTDVNPETSGEPIHVESVIVLRKNGEGKVERKEEPVSQTVITPEDSELMLDIF